MIEGRITATAQVRAGEDLAEDGDLAAHILDIMEQGVIVWGADGRCVMHNSRVYQLLEISPEDLGIGTTREEFRARSVSRSEMTAEDVAAAESLVRLQPLVLTWSVEPSRVARCQVCPGTGRYAVARRS